MSPRVRLLARAGLVAVLVLAPDPARPAPTPGRLVVLDAFADPFGVGHFGALFEADPHAAPEGAAASLSSSADLYQASDLAWRADRSLVVVDRDADPSGFGADPNGDYGPGALFVAAATDQALSLLADGSDVPAGLPPGVRTVFVDPRGVAVAPTGDVLVVDTDADPSGLGLDSAGFAGHGAILVADASGTIRVVSDGSASDDGPPPRGAASWFEDPGAACVTADGRIFVLDLFGDPLAVGGRGAVFEVSPATGRVRLVAVSPLFAAPVAIAERAPSRLVVTDQLADLRGDGSRGAVFEVDLSQPDPRLAVSVVATDARFRGPAGAAGAVDGSVFIADPFADPLGLGRIGSVFRLRPDGSVHVASAAADFRAPVSVRPVPPTAPAPVLMAADPPEAEAGQALTLSLSGAGFAGPAELRLGDGVTLTAPVRILAPDAAEVDVVLDVAAPLGARDVVLVNADLQAAALAGGFTVLPRASPEVRACEPPAAVQGTSQRVVVTGDLLADGASLDLGPGVTLTDLVRRDATRLEADAAIGAAAPPGPRDVVVTNPDGTRGSLVAGFTVLEPAPPAPASATPSSLLPGTATRLTIDGTGFEPGMEVDLGPDVTTGPVQVDSPFRASCRVHAALSAPPGTRDLVATNPGGRSGRLDAAVAVADVPHVRIVAAVALDGAGNATGHPDPGETVDIDVIAYNDGPRALSNPAVRVSSPPGSGLLVLRGAVTLGSGAPGPLRRSGPPMPEAHVDATAACGAALPLRVEVLEAGVPVAAADMLLRVGAPASHGRKPTLDGTVIGGQRGGAVALADLDGDGAADLVAGAPREEPAGLYSAGRVMAVSGLTDDPLWSLDGIEADGRLGASLAAVGDVDGDGAEDLLVGAPGEAAGAGRVRLVSGADGRVLATRDGDAGDGLGAAVAATGDADLDGRPEALVGAPDAAGGAGLALRLGLPELDERGRLAGMAGDGLGTALAGIGDRDGDGRADAAVGAPGGSGPGRVVLWHADGATLVIDGADAGERFGAALAGGADVDLDGMADLLAGAPGADVGPLSGAGRLDLVSLRTLARSVALGGEAGAALGSAVAFAGDLDADGSADIAVGEPGAGRGDGLVALLSGADLHLIRTERGPAGMAGRFGASLDGGRAAGGDAFDDLAVGAPLHPQVGLPRAGRAFALKTVPECAPVFACDPDADEPNGPSAPTAIGYGERPGLTICRDDVDSFRLDLTAGRRALALIRFRHAQGDLDATLHDAVTGAVVDQSLSLDDDEQVGPAGPGGSWEVRVVGFDGATNTYDLLVLDPDSCPPAAEVTDLRVRKTGGVVVVTWRPSTDACHAPPPGPSYRVWEAPSPAPVAAGEPFPTGSAFVDVTGVDGDGDLANETYVTGSRGRAFWLVTDVGRAGEDGPAGWPAP